VSDHINYDKQINNGLRDKNKLNEDRDINS